MRNLDTPSLPAVTKSLKITIIASPTISDFDPAALTTHHSPLPSGGSHVRVRLHLHPTQRRLLRRPPASWQRLLPLPRSRPRRGARRGPRQRRCHAPPPRPPLPSPPRSPARRRVVERAVHRRTQPPRGHRPP